MDSKYYERSQPQRFAGGVLIEPLAIDFKWHFESLVRSPSSLNQTPKSESPLRSPASVSNQRRNFDYCDVRKSACYNNQLKKIKTIPDATSDFAESCLSEASDEDIIESYSPATSLKRIRAASEFCLKSFQEVADDPDSDLEELCNVFNIFDKNGDGKLSTDEIRDSLEKLGLKMTPKEFDSMMLAIDKNRNGYVDLEEFLSLYEMQTDAKSPQCIIEEHDERSLKRAFGVFDQNNDGFITAKELQTVLCNLGLPQETCKLVDCRNMIRGADLDGDGKINFMEFKLLMSPRRSRCRAESSNSMEKSLAAIQVSFSGKSEENM